MADLTYEIPRANAGEDQEGTAMPAAQPTVARWTFSKHARQRMTERSIASDEVRRALMRPDRIYVQLGYGPYREVRQAGRIAAIVDPVKHHVITVVFRDPRLWLALEATKIAEVAA